ncbi:tripartite tricarboxylate transporter substrate binding protein [Bordetella sp. 15P40C-2]|uniref:Bug family tripartite tricarboxylate transporter substrate binding protein n=1 Tax=Bordetella sp. 15P40C-2 TaxID=2572246 RepID=UPI001328E105|nr:tripartite tricarboxylate transporter substrate binding protein [Bordetella sp. 15P40C-2]MVW70348.1 tripartite tricarboxylate transporter substrate binding protein [Bordetella sp. 15P40C-2]
MNKLKSLLCSLMLAAATPAQAAYPEKPVRIIVPYAAGGSSDVLARGIGDQLAKELGQPVVVENRAGAGSMIGTSYVANEAPDGYTLLLADVPFTIVPALYADRVKYDARKDFTPVALLGVSPLYLFVNPGFEAQTVPALVSTTKDSSHKISIGSGGNGSLTHLMAELFMQNTGAELVHIPYKGASASANDLAGGQIQASFTTMPTAAALYQAGKIKPIAVSSPERMKDTPDVPTFAELNVPNMTVQSWWGLMAPAGTPADALARLEAAMKTVMQSEAVQQRLVSLGVSAPADSSAKALSGMVTEDFARWDDVIKRANIKFE